MKIVQNVPKFLLVGLDGLRPDMMSQDLTPNVWSFARENLRFTNNRASYPTETYPNVASLITGNPPGIHGIVANEFLTPSFDSRRTWHGVDIDRVEHWNQAHGGRFHSVPTIGDVLGSAGKTFWTISTETAGSSRLFHPTVDQYPGHICMIIKAFERSRPRGITSLTTELAGPLPQRYPADVHLEDQSYATDVFLALEKHRGMPEAAVVWYGGTDHSMHVHGLGAEETLRMIRHVDAEFGRLVQWWQSHPAHDSIQIVVVSDHGHVTQTSKINVKTVLRDAGFKVDTHLQDGAQIAHNSCYGWSGNIRIKDNDSTLLKDVSQAMMAHPAIGMIFTHGRDAVNGMVEGSFAQSLVKISHPERTADIDYCLRDYDDTDPFGHAGTCWADNPQRVHASNHGGLHAKAMEAILLLAGSAFGQGKELSTPSGIVDVAPTILHLLGLPHESMSGRVLAEAWDSAAPVGAVEELRWSVGNGGYRQELIADKVDNHVYLRKGRRLE